MGAAHSDLADVERFDVLFRDRDLRFGFSSEATSSDSSAFAALGGVLGSLVTPFSLIASERGDGLVGAASSVG